MGKYIDGSGLAHFMGIIKGWAVPNTRKVNGHALTADVTVSKSDVGLGNVTNTEQAPKSHASSNTTYGLGSGTNYGHVKLLDTPDVLGNVMGGVAATPKSVFDALEEAKTYADGHANQNAFSNVKVGSTTIAADTTTDTLELVAGSNVTLTPDATNDKVTIAATDTTALGSMTGTLGVAHGGTGVATLGAGVVYHSASGTGALSLATAANLVSALGTTAVNRATADASGNNIANTYATKTELGTATAGALQYKGVVDAESTITGASYKKGWYYVVGTAGTYVGKTCEVGDMLIAKQDKSSTVANDWDAVQSNIEVLSNSEIDTLWAAA